MRVDRRDLAAMHEPDRLERPTTRYERWNAAIADEFFSGRWGGRPVYLDLEDDVLRRIAVNAGEAAEDPAAALVDAVRPTLRLAEGGTLLGMHIGRLARWKRVRTNEPPPVLAVLALFSLVAERMRSDSQLSAANYYGRFLQLLGEDALDESLRAKVVRGFSDESHALWNALNDWLSSDPETRGFPTAYAFDFRVHVGVPMSQALVREPDRIRLQQLFAEARLQPGERLAHSDMARLLADWVPESPLSVGLKTLCEQPEVLERVAAIACVELESWTGDISDTALESQRSGLALVARFRSIPRRRLELALTARLAADDDRLTLAPDSPPAALAALEGSRGIVELGPANEAGWRDVTNLEAISMPDLLLARLRLEASHGASVSRVPRRMILLERDESALRYVEVSRARLGAEYLVLVIESLQSKLLDALRESARPGFRALRAKMLPGLPEGWIAYIGVQVVAITRSGDADLASLVPVAWSQVSFSGGLKLPGRGTWHTDAPPEILASSLEVTNTSVVVYDEGAREVLRELGEFDEAAVFSLEPQLPPGDYRVAILQDEKAIASAPLRLRSASPADGAPPEGARVDRREALVAGIWGERGARGALGWDELSAETVSAPALVPGRRIDVPGRPIDFEVEDPDEEEEVSPPPVAAAPRPQSLADCVETGAHYFTLDSRVGVRYGAENMFGGDCRYCGLEKFFPARPRRGKRRWRKRAADRRTHALHEAARSLDHLKRRSSDDDADLDALLDALSLLGSGEWSTFQRLVQQHDDRPWASAEIARTLAALGHIDLVRDRRTLRPLRWSVSPTTIVLGRDAFLCGFRSSALIDELAAGVEALGLRLTREEMPGAPSRLGLGELDDEAARRLGANVLVAQQPARDIAECLPPLRVLRDLLPAASLAGVDKLERFDLDTGRWTTADTVNIDGAYRSTGLPRRHWHRQGGDTRLCVDPLSKWLAAADEQPLLGFDAGTGRLVCHLGAPPPLLFERAVVLCSGRVAVRQGGHAVYGDVDPAIAATVAVKLHVPIK